MVWITLYSTCSSQTWLHPSRCGADVPPGDEGEAKAKGASIGSLLADVLMPLKGTLL